MATFNTTWLKRTINNVLTKTFAISHVKSTYYNYENNTMLDDVLIETEDFDQSAVTESEISPVILSKINAVATQSANNFTLLSANKAESSEVYTRAEVDNIVSALKQECDWKESVETYDDISTTYPNPEDGWTVTVKDTNITYRYNGTNWIDIYTLAQLATESNDGLMSKTDFSKVKKIDGMDTKLSALDEQLNTHISDTINHVSPEERKNWNLAKTHADSVHARTDATKVSKSSTNGNVLINGSETNVYTHPSGTNPHGTTKSDVGLGNVENKSSATIRGELTKSNVTTALGYTPLDSMLKGSTNGVAELDSNGKVPASQLPSYVDDVIEGYFSGGKFYKESSHSTVITGESGKIYIDLHTEKTYRWSGTKFSVVSETLALGETSSTAYRGDRGKTAYEHSQSSHAPSNAQANVIETVQVNGTALTPSSKAVNVPVPTKVSDLLNDMDLIPHNVIYIQIGDEDQNGFIDYYYNGKKTRMTANTGLTSVTTVRLPATGGTLALASSDKRLKDNIDDSVVNAIDLIKKIKMRQFDWNNNEQNGYLMNTHQDIGFIADELEELDKRLALGGGIDEDGEMDIKTVDTFYLLGYVVKALQEIISKLDM